MAHRWGCFMIHRNRLAAAGAALALFVVAGAASAATVSATANATATIISSTTITKVQDMEFGTVVRPTSGSNTFSLGTNDAVTVSGAGDGSVVASTTSAARFTLASQAAVTYTLAPTLSFVQSGLSNIVVGTPIALSGTLGTLGANGSQDVKYGAAFDVSSTTPTQAYTGTLSVVVTYN